MTWKVFFSRSAPAPVTALLALGLLGCGNQAATGLVDDPAAHASSTDDSSNPEVAELTSEQIEKGGIRIEESRKVELQQTLETTGTVTPDESRVAHIRPLAQGVIEKVYVRRGDRVKAGQPLILYDNIELGEVIGQFLSERSQLDKFLADQEVAEKFWQRGVELLEAQAIARKEVELREAQYKDAQAMVESRRSEIARTEEKLHRFGLSEEEIRALDRKESSSHHRTASHNTLRAPFPGVIIGYNVAEGELVEPSREVLTVADVGTVWVLADVYEKDLGRIGEGREVEIVSESYPDRVFRGRLTYISDVLEKETRTVQVRCVVPNPGSLLKLEMFVTVRIPTVEDRSAIAVPEEAVQNIDGRDVVFVAEKPGRFRMTPVTTGLRSGGWIEVTGLEIGAAVVCNGSFYLKTALKRSEIQSED